MSKEFSLFERLQRAEEFKRQLIEFATVEHLKEDYQQQKELFFELAEPEGEHESQSLLEWFLYDWIDDYGEGAIDHFVDSRDDLSEEDETMLLEWMASINSVFEIKSVKKNAVSLSDLETDDVFSVMTLAQDLPFQSGQFVAARLLPFADKFIFAGAQFIMPDRESALEVLQMRRSLEEIETPDSLEHLQQEQREAFIELFGSDEMTIAAKQLPSMIGRFQRYMFFERRDAETGKTAAEMYREECGQELKMPEIPPFPKELVELNEITILCDEFDGIVILPDYQTFKRVFDSSNPDKEIPEWKELLWEYIEDPSIPIVAFERVAETHPLQVEKAMRILLDDETFSLEHLYAALLHYKQPVDGIEEMQDEALLWDLFDGSKDATKLNDVKTATTDKTINVTDGSNVIEFSSKSTSAKKP
jgi:hypothetical protein